MNGARALGQALLPGVVLVVAFLVTASLLSGPSRNGGGRPPRVETVYSVTAADIALGENRATLRAFGEVIAAEAAELRVASPGEVIAVSDNLEVGQRVEQGEALVTIDPFEYRGALRDATAQLAEARARKAEAAARISMEQSALARLEEQLSFAQRDLERAEQLSSSGTITDKAVDDRRLLVSQRQQAFDQGRYTLEAEEARRDQQTATIERLEWLVERAERALTDTVLRAPFDGIVRAENAAIGRLLATNDVAVALIGADALDVRFVLSDQLYGRLRFNEALFGTPVEVIWRVGDIPISYTGTVTRAGADIESARGGVDVFARLDLKDMPAPRPGAFVEVRMPGITHQGSARIPTAALYDGSVFLIGEDDRLVSVPVNVLALDDGEAIVEGELETGDVVVTTRLAEAGNGIKVRRVDPSAPIVAPAEDETAGLASPDAADTAEPSPVDAGRTRRRRGEAAPPSQEPS